MSSPFSPSPNATPFIPPLHTPGARTPPHPAPVLPNQPGQPSMPSWATPHHRPQPFPTAYSTHSTPYIPPGANLMPPPPHPAQGSSYFQTPHASQHTPLPQVQAEWIGFGPQAGAHTPHTPAGFHPGTPWAQPAPFQHAQPPPGTPYPGQWGGPPAGYGPPPPAMGGYAGWGPSAYPAAAHPSPWVNAGHGAPMPPMPGGFPPHPGAPIDSFYGPPPPVLPGGLSRSKVHVGDRVPPFTPGRHYGPALEPTLVKVLKCHVQINPLLTFPDSNTPMNSEAEAEFKYLKWNMLFESSYCQLSNDPPHASWSNGRNDPATFPKLTSLRLTFHHHHQLPWTFVIKPRNPNSCNWVTCGDVIDGISNYLQRPSSQTEYDMLPLPRQRHVSEAYVRNRKIGHDVPGGRLGQGLRKLDWLCEEFVFGGIDKPDTTVGATGFLLPCTFVVKCLKNWALREGEGGTAVTNPGGRPVTPRIPSLSRTSSSTSSSPSTVN